MKPQSIFHFLPFRFLLICLCQAFPQNVGINEEGSVGMVSIPINRTGYYGF